MPTTEELRALVRAAEAELEAATRRTDLNAAARKLMRAKAALKAAETAPRLARNRQSLAGNAAALK
jgi:hypothetical protein